MGPATGQGAVDALRADREVLLGICAGLDDEQWQQPSGCDGWRVQDVVAHMGSVFWLVVDPSKLPDTTGKNTEPAQDAVVEARRSWAAAEVVADYEAVSTQAIEILTTLEGQEFEIDLGDLGKYPALMIPNAIAFDHYTHIRADLFAPRGPLTGELPPSDELRLAPSLDWIEAALPQQNEGVIGGLPGTLAIEVTGPAARTIRLGAGDPGATVTSDSPGFVRWITQRSAWDDVGGTATGDESVLKAARSLRVF
jgi:uncharacterized protein (TIGR03083 family)